MSNSYRIRTQVGVDKSLKVLLDQDFEFLEILSLKILQSQIYTRPCSDYGVVIGRVTANDGFGIPNAKVSIFIPLTSEDETNPIIADLYPYKNLTELNEDGYRYNLLPYVKQHSGHNPTGTFFDREDVLTNPTLIEVFDKYYRYTARTNDSGDYMIFGVPIGAQTIHVDVDLSDIGEFSLSPQDLVRMGVATPAQVAGTNFKSSNNLNELPQIVTINRTIEVEPLWGQPEICNIGITRTDFDLTAEANITITPTAIFMGSLISSNDDQYQKRSCKPKLKQGNLCNLVAGPGEILAIRQTIQQDINGRPVLEVYDLEQGGQVIDENGAWMIDVPMNLDYVVTNEFGERVISNDPSKGIPTKGKYRFKVKWNQEPTLNEAIKRGYFLVPNIKEYGWTQGSGTDPLQNTIPDTIYAIKSYTFSLDWDDYGDTTPLGLQMIQEAIDCEDRFYPMVYNKVYTVSQLIDQYRKGYLPNRMVSLKNNLDDACESENVKFPNNDAILRFDLIYLLFVIMIFLFKPILYVLLIVVHILAFLLKYILGPILAVVVAIIVTVILIICYIVQGLCFGCLGSKCEELIDMYDYVQTMLDLYKYFTNLAIPNLSYSDCELCDCKQGGSPDPGVSDPSGSGLDSETLIQDSGLYAVLSKYGFNGEYIQSLNTTTFSYPLVISNLFAGQPIDTGSPSSTNSVPQLLEYDTGSGNYIFTNSLTIPERLNLFNNKAKYFDANSNNPGGGVNKIRVTFESNVNIAPTSPTPLPSDKWHLDNVIALSVVPSQLPKFTQGKIITFQNPELSQDLNLTGFTSWNQFGTSSMTGTSINIGPTPIQISYADPTGVGTISPSHSNYIITQDVDDATYHKFGMDMEYFQVITAMTYSSFSSDSNLSNANSLLNRILNNTMLYNVVDSSGCWLQAPSTTNPMSYFNDSGNQGIVFLVRGVDPNTSRRQHTYDLSILFGYNFYHNSGQFVVTGDYKMNYPIQGSYKSVSHTNMVADTTVTDTSNSTGLNLYYDSFHFQPSVGGTGATFTAFTSTLPSYYSSLDGTTSTFNPGGAPGNLGLPCNFSGTYGARVKNFLSPYNGFTIQYTNLVTTIPCNFYSPVQNTSTDTRGYFVNEIVEGGSVFLQNSSIPFGGPITQTGYLYAPSYTVTPFTFNNNVTVTNNQIVMRSDRLPTSTTTTNLLNNSLALHGNPNFSVYYLEDDGTSQNEPQSSNTPTAGDPQEGLENNQDLPDPNNVLNTFNCGNMIPLECYYSLPNGEVSYFSRPASCYENGVEGRSIFENGCYILVSSILGTLVNGKDFKLLTEWSSRIQITFAACRNVWSHVFTNSWINGTLYAFSFKNDRFFTSPTSPNPNQPYSVYCRDTVYLHPTNNFYYRSSPYDGTNFIGSDPPSGVFGNYGGNNRNLKYPTTIMDLGPRSFYLQELIMSDDYDGYVVNRLNETSFTDVEDILNLFILNRLTNTKFLESLFGGGGANVLTYFDQRSKNFVDGDYAQMISISSELGIADFESANYPSVPTQDPIYFGNANDEDVVFGIFYSSDTQLRDFITPKRTIISPTATVTDPCAFNYFRVFSQTVPFYQWDIKQNPGQNSIFGSQSNDWYTSPLGSSFLQNRYQSMDRLQPTSRYFRTNGSTQTQYFKGYIYSVDPITNDLSWSPSTQDPNAAPFSPSDRIITVGAPFHFYFGLKKGKTAFDRFAKQWIKFDTITD
jgi:hypothetical protein